MYFKSCFAYLWQLLLFLAHLSTKCSSRALRGSSVCHSSSTISLNIKLLLNGWANLNQWSSLKIAEFNFIKDWLPWQSNGIF